MYLLFKSPLLCAAVVSLLFFILRFFWLSKSPQLMQTQWVKVLARVVDKIVLASAIALCLMMFQHPITDTWLIEKVIGALIYIVFGFWAVKYWVTYGFEVKA